jgi:putative two-component system response regulator
MPTRGKFTPRIVRPPRDAVRVPADPDAGHDWTRVLSYCRALAARVGLDEEETNVLLAGAMLHDIGKVRIPREILMKPGALSDAERTIMRLHTVIGEQLCRPLRGLRPLLPLIRHHHERWDGSGYPDGLQGTRIPLAVRVLQIVDAYDALRSVRPYRGPVGRDEAIALLESEAARGGWDPTVMDKAVRLFAQSRRLRKAG